VSGASGVHCLRDEIRDGVSIDKFRKMTGVSIYQSKGVSILLSAIDSGHYTAKSDNAKKIIGFSCRI
jgi:hypothetical protein